MLCYNLWSFFLWKWCSITINLLFGQAWNTAVMFWASAPKCYLDILDRLQNCVCKTVDPSLSDLLESLAHIHDWLFWVYFIETVLKSAPMSLLSWFFSLAHVLSLPNMLIGSKHDYPQIYRGLCQQLLSTDLDARVCYLQIAFFWPTA